MKKEMDTNQRTARVAGILFIIAFVGAIAAGITKPITNSPDYLIKISTNPNPILIGALFVFIMAAASAGIGITLYSVLKKYNSSLALGAAGFRIMEAVFDIIGVVILLFLTTLSQEFVKATSNSAHLQTMGDLLLAGNAWIHNVAVLLCWSIGAFIYYYIFYRTKLIPRWLSAWGLIGITLTVISVILVIFSFIAPFSTAQISMNLPIALQEMVLALWLIIKGFNKSTIESFSRG